MKKRYQIFLSSTYVDLRDERQAILNLILNMGHIPVGMELFNAADESQWNIIKKMIDQSDYYILLVSDRYGSVDDNGIGYTEKEYDYAIQKGIPTISFLREDSSINMLPYEYRESDNKVRLYNFKDKVKQKLIKFWSNSNDLSLKAAISLNDLFNTKPQSGWIKGSGFSNSDIFYTLDDRPDSNFPHLIKDAKKVYILARTAVNLLGQYEKSFIDLIQTSCDVRLLFVGPQCDAVKYIYGSSPDVYFDNAKKMKYHIDNIKRKTGRTIEVKTINHAPTVSIVFIEKLDGHSFVVVQFYFLHALIGRDRPLFKLDKGDKWFNAFKHEFDELWNTAFVLEN